MSGNAGCTANDCIVEVNPETGQVITNWGATAYHNVLGLAFSGGKLYGFSDSGAVFEGAFGGAQIVTKNIPVSSPGSGFLGAGSTP